jgi:hypothetical protein
MRQLTDGDKVQLDGYNGVITKLPPDPVFKDEPQVDEVTPEPTTPKDVTPDEPNPIAAEQPVPAEDDDAKSEEKAAELPPSKTDESDEKA